MVCRKMFCLCSILLFCVLFNGNATAQHPDNNTILEASQKSKQQKVLEPALLLQHPIQKWKSGQRPTFATVSAPPQLLLGKPENEQTESLRGKMTEGTETLQKSFALSQRTQFVLLMSGVLYIVTTVGTIIAATVIYLVRSLGPLSNLRLTMKNEEASRQPLFPEIAADQSKIEKAKSSQ